MTTSTSNLYRKARALTAKTTTSGCTPQEHVSATNLAVNMITKHGLDPARIAWPEPPKGWRWSGITGQSEVVETPAKPEAKRTRKPKPKGEAKPPRATNGERLAKLAEKPDGFTIEDITTMLGVLPHTARALISVELRKKRGLNIVTSEGRYRVAPAA